MPNKNYLKGVRHEYAIKKKWEKDGWTVLRTAGSHGEFDLIAIAPRNTITAQEADRNFIFERPQIVLIQAKSGKSAQREKAKLSGLKAKYGGIYSVRVELL